MPNRILKESICTSENIDMLSAFQETVFYRLIVNCDDYGRTDARPKILAARLFPLKEIRTNQIEDALRALSSAELVILYTVGGKPFLQMTTWNRHQQIRAKVSKYPAPDDGIITNDINCNQMQADTSKCPRNPIQSKSNPNPNPNTSASRCAQGFDEFWIAYPKKQGKQQAEKAFNKIKPDRALLDKMLASIKAWSQSQQWTKDGGQYIPMPSTWLNGKRWEDEAPKAQGLIHEVSAHQYSQRDYTEEELEARTADLINEAIGL